MEELFASSLLLDFVLSRAFSTRSGEEKKSLEISSSFFWGGEGGKWFFLKEKNYSGNCFLSEGFGAKSGRGRFAALSSIQHEKYIKKGETFFRYPKTATPIKS